MNKVAGFLEVGTNGRGEVVINHPKIDVDEHGVGHLVFSVTQAQHLAQSLIRKSRDAEEEIKPTFSATPIPPVDRSQQCLTDGAPVTPDHREINPTTGMQKGYVVLSPEERAKGFVRPVRTSYEHVGVRPKYDLRPLTDEEKQRYADQKYVGYEEYPKVKAPGDHSSVVGRYWTAEQLASGCDSVTTMGLALAETYARDPKFYSGTFCVTCGKHFPVEQFVWDGTDERVGS